MAQQSTQFKTLAENAYQIIREKITKGDFEPGMKLTRRNMSTITGVSIIPVIEALQKLENEGLVVSEPHYGTRVIYLDDEIIKDRFVLRMAIECAGVRLLAYSVNDEQIHHLLFLAKALDSVPRTASPDSSFWSQHSAFHLKLAEATGHQSFIKGLQSIDLFEILKRSILNLSSGPTTTVPDKHHERIIEAILTRNPDHAEKVMRDHIHYSGLAKEDSIQS
jgi:DNA-binding GntR family transcriptional regulator